MHVVAIKGWHARAGTKSFKADKGVQVEYELGIVVLERRNPERCVVGPIVLVNIIHFADNARSSSYDPWTFDHIFRVMVKNPIRVHDRKDARLDGSGRKIESSL